MLVFDAIDVRDESFDVHQLDGDHDDGVDGAWYTRLHLRLADSAMLSVALRRPRRSTIVDRSVASKSAGDQSNGWRIERKLTREPLDLDLLVRHLQRGVDDVGGDVDDS